VIDPRTRRGLVPALVGLVLGILGVAADLPVLGLVAGLCALAVLAATTWGARGSTPGAVAPSASAPAPAGSTSTPSAPAAPTTSPATGAGAAGTPGAATGTPTMGSPASGRDGRDGRDPLDGPAPSPEPATAPLAPSVAGLQAAREGGSSLIDAHGLFSQEYFLMAVETRVSAARRHLRPVAVVLFEVGTHGGDDHADPALVATAIRATLREADTACRLAGDRYAFVLEDTPEDGALWTMERFRRVLQAAEPDAVRWAGIACYPAHAFSADGVLTKAEDALASAKEWGQDRVEVATAD
jgi:two-component system cell cycle response regulator